MQNQIREEISKPLEKIYDEMFYDIKESFKKPNSIKMEKSKKEMKKKIVSIINENIIDGASQCMIQTGVISEKVIELFDQETSKLKEENKRLREELEKQLSKPDLQFIEDALNEVWFQATQKLERKDLGDIDRKQTSNRQLMAKKIMDKVTKIAY